ncbi:hypothetical protein BC832DRAFT_590367 [Gaertneriomyces semiglobifer]|nr:hypothetical protein BC832DRAFT_590367 [Gaertneriomyces semiglobifer]
MPGTVAGQPLVCNTGSEVWKSSYSFCRVNAKLLKDIYPGDTRITVSRNLTSGQGYGMMWYEGKLQFSCQASGCKHDRTAETSAYDCDSLKCTCDPTGALCGGKGVNVNLSGPVNEASGRFEYICPRNETANCLVKFEFLKGLFPDGIQLEECAHGECALPSDDPGDTEASETRIGPGVIAGATAAGAVVAVGASACILGCVRARRARQQSPPAARKGVRLTFQGLTYSIGSKSILRNIDGEAYPGRVCAILGPSGAGKSSLLDILASRSKRGTVSGEFLVNQREIMKGQYRRMTGYVDQEDCLLGTLTVRETLMFSARLRLPECVSDEEKKERVEQIIELLGLSHVADSLVGGANRRGISGGEKRRVSIGSELVTDPAVLFLDEPTSGLDSYNAHAVVRNISDLAHTAGKTIILTIHQPRSDVYNLFDDVMVLRSGEVMYSGAARDVPAYLDTIEKPCPTGYNVADHLLDLAVGQEREQKEVSIHTALRADSDLRHRVPHSQVDTWTGEESITSLTAKKDASKKSSLPRRRSSVSTFHDRELSAEPRHTVGFITQLMVLTGRSWKTLWRQPMLWATHLGISCVLGAFVGGLYWQTDTSLAGIQNRFGSTFFLMALLGFSGLSAIGSVITERHLFVRERANGYYNWPSFFVTRVLFDLIPLRIVPSVILGSIAFWMVGYSSVDGQFVSFLGVLMLFAANCGLFCLLIGCAISDIGTASLVGSIALLFQMLFSGFLLNQDQIPAALRWIQYLSLFRYAYEALVINDMTKLTIVDNVSGLGVNVPAAIVLEKFGFDVNAFGRNVVVEAGWFVGFLMVIALVVAFKLRERR